MQPNNITKENEDLMRIRTVNQKYTLAKRADLVLGAFAEEVDDSKKHII
jgi:hypothetical protein